jgi:hypothetical protein
LNDCIVSITRYCPSYLSIERILTINFSDIAYNSLPPDLCRFVEIPEGNEEEILVTKQFHGGALKNIKKLERLLEIIRNDKYCGILLFKIWRIFWPDGVSEQGVVKRHFFTELHSKDGTLYREYDLPDSPFYFDKSQALKMVEQFLVSTLKKAYILRYKDLLVSLQYFINNFMVSYKNNTIILVPDPPADLIIAEKIQKTAWLARSLKLGSAWMHLLFTFGRTHPIHIMDLRSFKAIQKMYPDLVPTD